MLLGMLGSEPGLLQAPPPPHPLQLQVQPQGSEPGLQQAPPPPDPLQLQLQPQGSELRGEKEDGGDHFSGTLKWSRQRDDGRGMGGRGGRG